jgi:hypothetical protein
MQPGGGQTPPPLGRILLGLAVAAVATGLSIVLFGHPPASSILVVAAGGLAGFVAGRGTVAYVPLSGLGVRLGARAAARDRATDAKYLEDEIRWRWRNAAEGAGLAWLVWTPSGAGYSVPLVLRVRLRPYPVLTVRLRPGQLIGDIVAAEDRLRELMAAKGIRIAPVAADVVTIELR